MATKTNAGEKGGAASLSWGIAVVQQTLKRQEKLGTEHRVPCAPPMASPSPLPSTGMGTAAKTGLPARHGNAPLRTHSLAHPLTLHRGFSIPLCSPDPKSNPLLQDILAPIENPPQRAKRLLWAPFTSLIAERKGVLNHLEAGR